MGGGESFTSSSQKYCFYEFAQIRWFHVACIPPAQVSQATYLLLKSQQYNRPISWPLYSVLWKLHFYFKYIYFWQYSGQYFWNKFISLGWIWLQCKFTMNLAALFDYFSTCRRIFFLARDGVQYLTFFLFTQEIPPLLPKKLRTPYSRNLRVPTHNMGTSSFFPFDFSII